MSDSQIDWSLLYHLDTSALSRYIQDWECTNNDIAANVGEFTEVIIPGLERALDRRTGTDVRSPGIEAAIAAADELEAALAEGLAVHDVLRGALDDLCGYNSDFVDLVDTINGTAGPLTGDGNYRVDLAGGVVNRPAEPDSATLAAGALHIDGDHFDGHRALNEWRALVDEEIVAFQDQLGRIAEDAFEADDEAARLLNGISANERGGFNADAAKAVEEASISEQYEDAEEVVAILCGPATDPVRDAELAEVNDVIGEHAGEDHFAVHLMEILGPDGFAETCSRLRREHGHGRSPCPVVTGLLKNLDETLATATNPANDARLSDKWVTAFPCDRGLLAPSALGFLRTEDR